MKEFDNELSSGEKYSLSREIDSKQINNTDSKVLLRKWSMSPDEINKHKQTSFYVYLSNPENFVDKLVKVDPLDPEAYRIINMMKLKKQVKSDNILYGIKTNANLLDEYIDSDTRSIPKDILDFLKEKSVKI